MSTLISQFLKSQRLLILQISDGWNPAADRCLALGGLLRQPIRPYSYPTASAYRHCRLQSARQTPYLLLDTAYLSHSLYVLLSVYLSLSLSLRLSVSDSIRWISG